MSAPFLEPSTERQQADQPAAQGSAAPDRRLDFGTRVSLIIPCYNEQEMLPLLFERLQQVIADWKVDYEVLLIDDGSQDRTWEMMVEMHRRNPRWRMLRLGRNFGHQTALRAGLQAATGDLVALLDADLQDPPEVLVDFFQKWLEGYDVIYGVRRNRREGWFKRTCYSGFYRILSYLSEIDMPLDAGDFSVMDRRVVDLLKQMPERRPYLRGLRSWVGFRQIAIPFDRHSRAAGNVKYSYRKLLGLASDGILSFSILPLRVATWLGAGVSLVSFVGAIFTFVLRVFAPFFARFGLEPIPGTALILFSILFLGGVQLLCLGILGEYLGRIYENVKQRPLWTVSDTLGVPPERAQDAILVARTTPPVAPPSE